MLRKLAAQYCLNNRRSTGLLLRPISSSKEQPFGIAPSKSIHLSRQSYQVKDVHPGQTPISFNIINHGLESLASNTLAGSNVELNDVEICLDGETLTFNLTWLRDSCQCAQCTHQYSRQRLFTAKDFRRDLFEIHDIGFSQEEPTGNSAFIGPYYGSPNAGFLNIIWRNGHQSFYSINWLRQINSLYRESKLNLQSSSLAKFEFPNDDFYLPTEEQVPKAQYWNVSEITSSLQSINYNDLTDGFHMSSDTNFINSNNPAHMSPQRYAAMKELTRHLVTYGLARVVNAPRERNQVLRVAKSLAYERPTGYGTVFDVVIEPSQDINLAYSSIEFDLHSDLTYRESSPGVQILHCIRNSVEGGYSYFSDSFKAADTLRQIEPILFQTLCQMPATFVVRDPYRNIKFRRQQSVISLDHGGNPFEIYYSPFMLPPIGHRDDVKLFYLAYDKFTRLLQSKDNKVIVKMDLGDMYIFHNRRVLHGRSAYDPMNSNRFLQGCYMDWDEIKCLYEKLQSYEPVRVS